MMAEVPLAVDRRCVVPLLKDLRQRHFLVGDSILRGRAERSQNADAIRIAAGQQRGARGGADGLRYVEVGEADPVLGHLIEMGRANSLVAITAEVAVAKIVGEDDDEVGWRLGINGGQRSSYQKRSE